MAQFLDFMDMINGGGAGAAGDKFEGGGLLSDIANSLFSPRGSLNRIAPQSRPQGMGQMAQAPQMMPQGGPTQNPHPPMPQQPPVSQGVTTPQVQSASLNDLESLHREMVAAGILPPMDRGPTQNPHPDMMPPPNMNNPLQGIGRAPMQPHQMQPSNMDSNSPFSMPLGMDANQGFSRTSPEFDGRGIDPDVARFYDMLVNNDINTGGR